MFPAALFARPKMRNKSKSFSTENWLDKDGDTHKAAKKTTRKLSVY